MFARRKEVGGMVWRPTDDAPRIDIHSQNLQEE